MILLLICISGNTASICTARSMFLCACAVMQEVGAPSVQAEAIGCLQQLHLFAPRHLNLTTLVPTLCVSVLCIYVYIIFILIYIYLNLLYFF